MIVIGFLAPAQSIQLDPDKWDKKKKDYNHFDDYQKETEKEKSAEPIDLPTIPQSNSLAYILLSIIVIGIVIAIVVLGKNQINPKPKDAIDIDSIDENLDEVKSEELIDHLTQLVSQEQFKSALRILFLQVLHLLMEKEFIIWKRDKTNRTYVQELSSFHFSSDFQQAVLIFENAWYSNHHYSQSQFEKDQIQFEQLIQSINNSPIDEQ